MSHERGTDIIKNTQVTLTRGSEEKYARRVSICKSKLTEAIVVKIWKSWRWSGGSRCRVCKKAIGKRIRKGQKRGANDTRTKKDRGANQEGHGRIKGSKSAKRDTQYVWTQTVTAKRKLDGHQFKHGLIQIIATLKCKEADGQDATTSKATTN